jgi:hypothetical protein
MIINDYCLFDILDTKQDRKKPNKILMSPNMSSFNASSGGETPLRAVTGSSFSSSSSSSVTATAGETGAMIDWATFAKA